MPYKTQSARQVWLRDPDPRQPSRLIKTIWVDDDSEEDEKEIAKKYGGDVLSSMPIGAPYKDCFRTIKIGELFDENEY